MKARLLYAALILYLLAIAVAALTRPEKRLNWSLYIPILALIALALAMRRPAYHRSPTTIAYKIPPRISPIRMAARQPVAVCVGGATTTCCARRGSPQCGQAVAFGEISRSHAGHLISVLIARVCSTQSVPAA